MVKSSTVIITLLVAMVAAAPIPVSLPCISEAAARSLLIVQNWQIGAKNTPSHLNNNKPRIESPTLSNLLLNPEIFKSFKFSGLVEPVGDALANPPTLAPLPS
ncbi:hypothetical protein LV164_005014 [Aspergillus fumigatus]|jgi:hypothetical protein|uniref:Pheromone P-factor (Map2), putative n=3 Tax=Aspergillus fumigatus TaxID=746128 RepID=Q4X108_ASPFU|nr:pheromone P-factor (Map2), putative [Aspergillus fumigatus Af293]EDP54678.1 mating pheromone P-factor (Map2), putative [Aspergillus fumigatus A1163]KAF4258106.1 hypothetical protein CNMCM8057_003316 [Aspergillus fumigatus]EAL93457.1 pheromone P-factor (Map2), putative [Aspergillus fumigatus Af293]KAF4258915.1 hypothetical protein CNMCM8714_001938 [Aspergillus fumigatus]KAF4266988.1 hypothetical protein CNMCM8812_002454 [Aspergillus fumigatus]